jgi:hypothetical protein
VSSQSHERAGMPGTIINRRCSACMIFLLRVASCVPGLGNIFRENRPRLPLGWASIQEALIFESLVTLW